MEIVYPSNLEATQCYGYPRGIDYFTFDKVQLFYTDPTTSEKKECAVLMYFVSLSPTATEDPSQSPNFVQSQIV